MTDKQIIKAFECCFLTVGFRHCDACPLFETERCTQKLYAETFNFIKRQQSEIAELEAEIDKQYEQAVADIKGNIVDGGTSCHWCIDRTKAEAIKEFVKRFEEQASGCVALENGKELYETKTYTIFAKHLDNLVAEMAGADNEYK